MDIIWTVNIMAALSGFLLWRRTPAIMEVGGYEETGKTASVIFTLFITLFCLSVFPVLISAFAGYAWLTLSGQSLYSFSVLAFYIPHGIVLIWFVGRTCKAYDWNFNF